MQSTHSSLVSKSDSLLEERPLIELGRRRRAQRKKEKKQSRKRKKKRPASPVLDSDDSDVPLSQLRRHCRPPPKNRSPSVADDMDGSSVEVLPDSLLELARQTRLTQSGSQPHIIEKDDEYKKLIRNAPSDGEFTIKNILAAMQTDTKLYGNNADRAKYIKQLNINNKNYESK